MQHCSDKITNSRRSKFNLYAYLVWCEWSIYDGLNRNHFISMLLTKIGMHSSHYSCFRPFVNTDNTSHYFGVKQVLQIEPANYIRIIIGHPNLHQKQFPTASINAAIGIQWFRPVTSSPYYSSPLKEPGSPPKTIEFAPCTSGSCLSTSLCQYANLFLFVSPWSLVYKVCKSFTFAFDKIKKSCVCYVWPSSCI